MARSIVETVLGAIVLLVAIGFLGWAYARSNVGNPGGYELNASFDRADGIDAGADVRISGVKVGAVTAQSLDPESFRAKLSFSVRSDLKLPADTSAAIVSSGLLGGKFLSLVPGGDDKILQPGGTITLTQSSVNLEDLIGRYIFGQGAGAGASGGAGQPKPAQPPAEAPFPQ